MRIAVMVIALCLTAVVGLQSCTVMVDGHLSQNEGLRGGGASGILIALCFTLGAAFAIGLPRISQIIFSVAAAIGFLVGAENGFADLKFRGVVSLSLCLMSGAVCESFASRRLLSSRMCLSVSASGRAIYYGQIMHFRMRLKSPKLKLLLKLRIVGSIASVLYRQTTTEQSLSTNGRRRSLILSRRVLYHFFTQN